MVRLALKIVLLLVFVGSILYITDSYFLQDANYRDTIQSFKEANKEELSIVFFGNSHSYSSFDPRIFEQELGVSTINLAGSAQKLISTYVVADLATKMSKPDLAVINIFKTSFKSSDNEEYKKINLNTLDYLPFSFAKIQATAEIFPLKEWPLAYSQMLRHHSNWHTLTHFEEPKRYPLNQDVYKGFNTYRTNFDSKTYATFEKKHQKQNPIFDKLTSKEKRHIENVIHLFKKMDIPVLFVNAPSYVYDVSTSFKTHADEVARYLKQKGAKYIEFNKIKDSLGLDKRHYRNPNHLNTNGAIITSQYLANYIKDSLQFTSQKGEAQKTNNRYFHLLSSGNTALLNTSFDSITTQKLLGIEAATFYKVSEDRFELIFPLKNDSIGAQPFRLEHDITKEEFFTLDKRRKHYINFSKDSTKAIYYGTFSQKDIIEYNHKKCVVFPIYTPLKKLKNLSFHAGKQRRITAFRIDSLLLDK